MHADAFFSQGSGHAVCQDYALSGNDSAGRPFAIVADGCSSSPQSDVGARLLAHAAATMLQRGGDFCPARTLTKAGVVANSLGLPERCLDSTLSVLRLRASHFEAWLIGDGSLAALRHDGGVEQLRIAYQDNHPAYLSYLSKPARLASYLARQPQRQIVWQSDKHQDHRFCEALSEDRYVFKLRLCRDLFTSVTLMSDGLQTFRAADGKTLDDQTLAAELLSFRSHRGQFVTRRARRMLQRHRQQGTRPFDDFAAATVCGCQGAHP